MNEIIKTKCGFKWGFLEVERTVSNDGTDKRKKFNVLTIKHENGESVEIIGTKEGLAHFKKQLQSSNYKK